MDEKTLTRFMAKVDQSGDCWTWVGAKIPEGYGSFWCEGRQQGAHRLAFEHFNGHVAGGLVIDHRCRNRACVNPDHLEAVDMLREGVVAEQPEKQLDTTPQRIKATTKTAARS